MNNLEKLMLLSCRPTTEEAIKSLRRDNGEHSAPSKMADDLMLYNRMMEASIDRRKLNPETQADCSHSDKLQGFRPYHCTYPSCSTGGKLYHSRTEWMEHEVIAHQQLWSCRDHHSFSCYSRDAFERHLMEEHRSLKDIHRKAWMDIYKPATKDLRRHCPVCLTRTEQLVGENLSEHIAEHLEQFALCASACKASDVALQVSELFKGSRSYQAPWVQDEPAHAPGADLAWGKLVRHTVATSTRDRIPATPTIPDTSSINNSPERRTMRTAAEDGKDNIKREATSDGGPIDTDTDQRSLSLESSCDRPDIRLEANCGLEQNWPSFLQPVVHPPVRYRLFSEPTLPERPPPPPFSRPNPFVAGSYGAYWGSRATSAASGYFGSFAYDPQSFVDGGLRAGSPTHIANAESNPWLPVNSPSLVASPATGQPSPGRRRRDSERGTDSDPRTIEPPRSRYPRRVPHHERPRSAEIPTLQRQCNMGYCKEQVFNRRADLLRHQHAYHSHLLPMEGPQPPSGDSGSPPEPLGCHALCDHRERPIEVSQKDRSKSNISAVKARQTCALPVKRRHASDGSMINTDTGAVHQLRDWPQEGPTQEASSAASYGDITRPMSAGGTKARSQLAGERQPGVKIGSDSPKSPSDSSFGLRPRPREFFKAGKVFLKLWTDPTAAKSIAAYRFNGALVNCNNEQVFTKVRRFIVVQAGEEYCHALPITTYSGRGVASQAVNESEHAVVYTGGIAPLAKWDEHPKPGESGMKTIAIDLDPGSSADYLHEMSRINLCDVVRINYDAEVKSHGNIKTNSMRYLLEAFRTAWSLDGPVDSIEDDHEDWILLDDNGGENDDDDDEDVLVVG